MKSIFARSLHKYTFFSVTPLNGSNGVLRGFLEADATHLNYWGYQALVNELVVPLKDHTGTMVNYRSKSTGGKMTAKNLHNRMCPY